MSDKTKVKIALAEAITKQLWVKGLITQKQREQIDKNSQKTLAKADCYWQMKSTPEMHYSGKRGNRMCSQSAGRRTMAAAHQSIMWKTVTPRS